MAFSADGGIYASALVLAFTLPRRHDVEVTARGSVWPNDSIFSDYLFCYVSNAMLSKVQTRRAKNIFGKYSARSALSRFTESSFITSPKIRNRDLMW